MILPPFDLNAELVQKLGQIFACHPRENLHLESTGEWFLCLRKRAENIGNKPCTPEVANIFTDENFVNYYKECLFFLVSDGPTTGLTDLRSPTISHFLKLHTSLWDICKYTSNNSYRICKKMCSARVHEALWSFVSRRELVASICVKEKYARLLVYCSFGILLNLLRRALTSVYSYRKCNGVHILRPFVAELRVPGSQRRADDLKTAAILLLLPIINVNENASINSNENYVAYILSAVRSALQSPEFCSPLHKHQLRDLNRGLHRLARFDDNKRKLFDAGVLEDISKMLTIAKSLSNTSSVQNRSACHAIQHISPNELASKAISLLWQLCFLSEIREQVTQDKRLLELSREFAESKYSAKCRKAVEGLFWTLSNPSSNLEMIGDINSSPLTTTTNPHGHIVFAFNNANHRIVEELKLALRKFGYNVYDELECMRMFILLY